MKKEDFYKGKKVYLKILRGSNAARYIDKTNPDAWIKEKIVSKVGRKYIVVTDDGEENRRGEEKFDITNDFRHCYTIGCADYHIYLSREAIEEDMQIEKIYGIIRSEFSSYSSGGKYTLKQLEDILSIIENK